MAGVATVVLLLYAVACFLPALYYEPPHRLLTAPKPLPETMMGYDCLLSVPFAFFTVAWWANPLFFTGLIAVWLGRPRTSLVLATLAVLTASTILVDFPVYVRHDPGRTFIDRSKRMEGADEPIEIVSHYPENAVPYYLNERPWARRSGCYVWLASQVVFLALAWRWATTARVALLADESLSKLPTTPAPPGRS